MTGTRSVPTFGLDDFGLDERMRLFSYVTAENRFAYLGVLRAFDAARADYHVLLHASEVAAALTRLGADALAAAMQETGRSVMEERLLPRLLADLAATEA